MCSTGGGICYITAGVYSAMSSRVHGPLSLLQRDIVVASNSRQLEHTRTVVNPQSRGGSPLSRWKHGSISHSNNYTIHVLRYTGNHRSKYHKYLNLPHSGFRERLLPTNNGSIVHYCVLKKILVYWYIWKSSLLISQYEYNSNLYLKLLK